MKYKEVYGVQFNVEAVSSLSVAAFKKMFKNKFRDNAEEVYYKVTGKKKPKKKVESNEEKAPEQ